VKEFRHPWTSTHGEYADRRAIFETELARVQGHNAKGATWSEGINKFSAYSATEKKVFLGRSKNANKHHTPKFEKPFPANLTMRPVSELPASVDWRSAGIVSAVKDQGGCGSCWAFCSTETLESHVALSTGLLYDLSPQQVAMCTPNPEACGGTGGCMGATSELAFDYVAGFGITEEYQIGYSAYYGKEAACGVTDETTPVATIDGYVVLPTNSYEAMMNAVAQVGPVAIALDADWSGYESGIYNGCNQVNPDINHGVVLVGYGEENGQKYWTIRNSWSPSWGEQGYIRLARFDNEDEICGLDITPQDGTACAGDDTPVKVCGTCGILFDGTFPVGAKLM
jgi:cathepsin L